ncbi:MAG: type II toxin-antitoxin system death-on-curing family toxin [Aestuariivirga sp.]
MKSDANRCLHLTIEIVLEIHAEVIAQFGGSDGLRDRALLESAVAAPQASFGGVSPFSDTVDVAAAYLFYLCSNHPFIDGNKRAAIGACLVLLQLNGYTPAPDSEEWESLTFAVARGSMTREEVTARLRILLV